MAKSDDQDETSSEDVDEMLGLPRKDPYKASNRWWLHEGDDFYDLTDAVAWRVSGYPGSGRMMPGIFANLDLVYEEEDIGSRTPRVMRLSLVAHGPRRAERNLAILGDLINCLQDLRLAYLEAINYVKAESEPDALSYWAER